MKTNITQVCAAAIGTMLLAGLSLSADAQLSLTGTSYTQNFNAIESGLPTGWTVRTAATNASLGNDVSSSFMGTVGAGTQWTNTSGGSKNVASATAFATYGAGTNALQATEVNRALGIKQVASTNANFPGSDPGCSFVLQLANTVNLSNFNLTFKLQSLDSTASRTSTWKVDYATGANPTSFTSITPVSGILTTGGNTYTNNTVTVNFGTALNNISGSVYIRVVNLEATSGTGSRALSAIDDVNLTWTGAATATNILATNYTPTGNNVPLATNQLTVKYDNPIAKGTGNFTLIKHGSATPAAVIDVTSSAVTVNDSTAVISLGAYNLENNTNYFVHAGAGIMTKTGGTLPSLAIADSTTWAFKTVDTVTPPAPTPLTVLNEKFLNCINTEMGAFVQYSEVGANNTWRCSRFGRNKTTTNADSFAVYINGGTNAGAVDNKDWLITKAPLDFSAMNVPTLSFWQNRRFAGAVTRAIKVSTDYVAGTNPANATWTTLNVPAMASAPDSNVWRAVQNIDLTAYKATPFYLAFTYECTVAGGAYELTYDDIIVAEPTSIKTVKGANMGIQVLGEATTNQINLNIDMKANDNIELQLFDLLGRKVATQKATVQGGANRVSFTSLNLNAGMYVIRVIGTNGFGTVKAVVK